MHCRIRSVILSKNRSCGFSGPTRCDLNEFMFLAQCNATWSAQVQLNMHGLISWSYKFRQNSSSSLPPYEMTPPPSSRSDIEYKCIRHGMESSKINYLHFRIVFVGIIIFEGDITTWELGREIHKEPPSAIIWGSCWLPRPVCPSKWNGMLASVSAASAVWPRKIWN